MWQYSFDVDPDGRLYLAVGGYGAARRGLRQRHRSGPAIRTTRAGPGNSQRCRRRRTWNRAAPIDAPPEPLDRTGLCPGHVPDARRRRRQRDDGGGVCGLGQPRRDVAVRATGAPASAGAPQISTAWSTTGCAERAERTADGDVIWAYGDGRLAIGRAAGRTAIFGATESHIEVR